MKSEKAKVKTKAMVLAICIVFLVAISGLVSAGDKPENLTDSITDDMNRPVNKTVKPRASSWPDIEVTAKTVEPSTIKPGGEGTLNLTISEVDGFDWAKDTNVYVEILNSDGCYFLESGSSQAEKYLGRIEEYGSEEVLFNLKVPSHAPFGERTVDITVEYWETGWGDIGIYGPYYEYASIDFSVIPDVSPTVSISTDKTSYTTNDTMHLGLNITNPGGAQTVRFATWLEQPAGWIYVLTYTSVTLPAELDYNNSDFVVLTLPDIPAGTYTWHAALIEPSGPIVIIRQDMTSWDFVPAVAGAPTEDIAGVLEHTAIAIDLGVYA